MNYIDHILVFEKHYTVTSWDKSNVKKDSRDVCEIAQNLKRCPCNLGEGIELRFIELRF